MTPCCAGLNQGHAGTHPTLNPATPFAPPPWGLGLRQDISISIGLPSCTTVNI